MRVLERLVERVLVDVVLLGPVVEQALHVVVEEDHLCAAGLVGGGDEAREQRVGGLGVEVVRGRGYEALRVGGGLLLVEEADVDVAPGLVRVVLGDLAAVLGRDVADREDVLVGELVANVADDAGDVIDGGARAEPAPRPADHVAVAIGERRGVAQHAGPGGTDTLSANRTADDHALAGARRALGFLAVRGVLRRAFVVVDLGVCSSRECEEAERNDERPHGSR